MKNKISFSMISIYMIITSFVNSISSQELDDFPYYEAERCFPFEQYPCGDEAHVCQYVQGYYYCIKKATLGLDCLFDEECQNIRNAECSLTHKCQCKSNYVGLNKTTCAPSLGILCLENEICAANNSACIENECKCSQGFVLNANNECVEKFLGMPCNNDLTCASSIKHTVCFPNDVCQCMFGFEAIGQKQCAPILDTPCIGNETCATANSMCTDNVCQCTPNFVKENSRCGKKYLDGPCETDADCEENKFLICSLEKRCTCVDGYVLVNRTMCVPVLEGSSRNNHQCPIENSICIDFTCRCKPEYLLSASGQCVPVFFLESCQVDADCNAYKNARCSRIKKCVCNSNLVAINETSCTPLLGDYCSTNHRCTIENSECIDNKCQCKAYHLETDNHCIPALRGMPCRLNSDCDSTKNLKCSKDNICVCNDNFTSFFNDSCVPISNGFCSNDKQCAFNNFHCVDNKCQCKPDFVAVSTHQCNSATFVYPCTMTMDCNDPWHTSCIDNKCICLPNNLAINNATCYPMLGGFCWFDHQCLTKNSQCIDYHCKCKDDFIASSDNSCVLKE